MRQWRLSRRMRRTEWRCRRAQGLLSQVAWRRYLHIRIFQACLIPHGQPLVAFVEATCGLRAITLSRHCPGSKRWRVESW
jgi:hypothetical protein